MTRLLPIVSSRALKFGARGVNGFVSQKRRFSAGANLEDTRVRMSFLPRSASLDLRQEFVILYLPGPP
jgi:hypothetical protein